MKRNLKLWIRFWPPLLGAGIRVTRLDPDYRAVDIQMRMHFWNSNYVGTHYGGSIYSMADPFYMVMLIENLGRDYIVWDKEARIRFRRPGTGTLTAHYRLSEEQIQQIREQLNTQEKVEPIFTLDIRNEQGEVVAEVEKRLHVRKKKAS